MRRFRPAFALLALLVSAPAWADEAGLKRCRGIADSAARLGCYDALPLESPSPVAPRASPSSGIGGVRESSPPGLGAKALEAQFGLPPAMLPGAEVSAVESTIPGLFDGWRPYERIRLANGQVWQIADESTSLLQRRDPKVTVRRGALGAFYLEIEGDNRSPRVRRVQ